VRILLDESVPVQVRRALHGYSVATAVEMGWRGVGNSELLDRAEAEGFELVVVADKNLRHQQNLRKRRITILELWTNHRPLLSGTSLASAMQCNQPQRLNTLFWNKRANSQRAMPPPHVSGPIVSGQRSA
jgi:hypothetical protein